MIGVLNDIVFVVSADFIRTVSDIQKNRSARIAKHEVIGSKPKLEFQGEDLVTMSFGIRLDASLGVAPQRDINKLSVMESTGEIVDFVVGDVYHGSFLIDSISEVTKYTDRNGNVTVAELSVSMTEYIYD
jgi:phage protein U